MGNKNGNYEALMEETKQLLMERTGKKIWVNFDENRSEVSFWIKFSWRSESKELQK